METIELQGYSELEMGNLYCLELHDCATSRRVTVETLWIEEEECADMTHEQIMAALFTMWVNDGIIDESEFSDERLEMLLILDQANYRRNLKPDGVDQIHVRTMLHVMRLGKLVELLEYEEEAA